MYMYPKAKCIGMKAWIMMINMFIDNIEPLRLASQVPDFGTSSELENSVLEINHVTNVTTVLSETTAWDRVSCLVLYYTPYMELNQHHYKWKVLSIYSAPYCKFTANTSYCKFTVWYWGPLLHPVRANTSPLKWILAHLRGGMDSTPFKGCSRGPNLQYGAFVDVCTYLVWDSCDMWRDSFVREVTRSYVKWLVRMWID